MWLLPVFSALSGLAARSFYRLEITGPEVPSQGPVLLFANHPNSLLDPALVAAAAGRRVRFLAKSPLFSDSRVGWLVRGSGAIPVHRRSDDAEAASRNVEMFASVHRELAAGAAVGIFPEGISHGGSSLARLKTGSARIALGAWPETGLFPLIPIGLVLREKGAFRSEVLVIRGLPVEWEDLAGESAENQEAVRELTRRLDESLRQVTINLEKWEDRPLVECAEAVWSAEFAEEGEPTETVRRAQTAASVLADLRRSGGEEWRELARQVQQHRRRLAVLGLEPADLSAAVDLGSGLGWTLRRLHLVAPPTAALGLAGAVVFWVPYQLTDLVVRSVDPGEDQRSTYKVLVGAVLYLLWLLALAGVAWSLWGPWSALGVLAVAPFLGFAGQWVRERLRGVWREARRFVVLRSRQQVRQDLLQNQRLLADRLHRAYEEWRRQEAAVD